MKIPLRKLTKNNNILKTFINFKKKNKNKKK